MCVFCKIIEGSIPSTTIYEDDVVKCILDLSQAGVGHTLVIPKKHFANVIEIDSYAFRRCGKLSGTLTIPASVKRIGKQIVADCSYHRRNHANQRLRSRQRHVFRAREHRGSRGDEDVRQTVKVIVETHGRYRDARPGVSTNNANPGRFARISLFS